MNRRPRSRTTDNNRLFSIIRSPTLGKCRGCRCQHIGRGLRCTGRHGTFPRLRLQGQAAVHHNIVAGGNHRIAFCRIGPIGGIMNRRPGCHTSDCNVLFRIIRTTPGEKIRCCNHRRIIPIPILIRTHIHSRHPIAMSISHSRETIQVDHATRHCFIIPGIDAGGIDLKMKIAVGWIIKQRVKADIPFPRPSALNITIADNWNSGTKIIRNL